MGNGRLSGLSRSAGTGLLFSLYFLSFDFGVMSMRVVERRVEGETDIGDLKNRGGLNRRRGLWEKFLF